LARIAAQSKGTCACALEIDPLGGSAMLDLIYITLTVAFFLIAIAYVRVCEKLQ
jgi:hypothetical protein